MKSTNVRRPTGTAAMLFIALIMILSTLPLSVTAENQYTVIVLTENTLYEVGDEVTLEIHFFDRDTRVDATEVNITIGYPEWGMGRYIEVDEESAKTATGIYSVSFTIREEDVMYGVSGTVRCVISDGRAEKEAESGFMLYMEGMTGGTFWGEIFADKPRFEPGDTVRFDVTFYNGTPAEKVDPDDYEASLSINGVEQSITLSQDSRAVGEYFYDYVVPDDGVSKALELNVDASFEEDYAWLWGEATLAYYQIWMNDAITGPTQFTGQLGVCDMNGAAVTADVDIHYTYYSQSRGEEKKLFEGTTNAEGLLDVTLDYDDINEGGDEWVDIEIWANGTGSRTGYAQWCTHDLDVDSSGGGASGSGFTVDPQHDEFFPPDTAITPQYRAFFDEEPLTNADIYVFVFTSPTTGMAVGVDDQPGGIYLVQKVTTDENGYFTLTFTTPDRPVWLMVIFKTFISDARDEGTWEVDEGMLSIFRMFEFDSGIDIQVDNFGLGQKATVTVTNPGIDGGIGTAGIFPMDHEMTVEELEEMMLQEFLGWEQLNDLDIFFEGHFTGDSYTRDIGIPSFFPDDGVFMIMAGMFVPHDGTRNMNLFDTHRYLLGVSFVDSNGDPVSGGDPRLKIGGTIPSVLESEEEILLTLTFTGSPAVEGAEATIEVTGDGSVDRATATTDANGEITFTLTADNVTGEDGSITLYVNGSKSGYQDGSFRKVISVNAYVEPVVEVTEPDEVDLGDGNTATIIAGIEGDVTITTSTATQPDADDPDAIGLYLNITKTGTGTLHWMLITVNYNELPDGIAPEKLRIFYWDEATSEWKRAENSGVDTVGKKVWANVTHLTIFAPRQAEGDITAPSITHSAVTSGTASEKIAISATVTDAGDGVKDVELFYRKAGNTVYKKIAMTASGDSYSAEIPGTDVYVEGVEYYIRATDGTNSATDPADQNQPHFITISPKKEERKDDDDKGFIPGFEMMILLCGLFIGSLLRSSKD